MSCRTCKSYPNCDGCNIDTLIKALQNGKFDFDEHHNVIIPNKVIHAEWFKSDCDFICTSCGIHSKGYHNYCPNCGAKMGKED